MWATRQSRVSSALKGRGHQCIKFRAAREGIVARFTHALSELLSINAAFEVTPKEFPRQSYGVASAIPEKIDSCAPDRQDYYNDDDDCDPFHGPSFHVAKTAPHHTLTRPRGQ